MGVAGQGQVVRAGFQNVGARAPRVVGTQLLLLHRDRQVLGLARLEQLGLGEAGQFHGRLLDGVGAVVIGVGALEVELGHVAAGHVARVGHIHGGHVAIVRLVHRVIGPVKARVRKTMAKGGVHLACVIEVARVALAQHAVLVAGLVVAVAHVDALGVREVLGVGHDVRVEEVVRLVAVGDEVVAEVLHGRRARGVGGVGVHQAAGRVHEAGQHVAHGVDAGLSGRAHPEHGVRVGQVAQRNGVGGVEHHDHTVEMGTRLVEQVPLLCRELQVADRQVGRLAARSADDHHGGIGVVRVAVAQLVGELAHGALVHGVVAPARDVGGLLAVILAGALLVEVPGGWVDLEARLLERLLEGVGLGGVHRA